MKNKIETEINKKEKCVYALVDPNFYPLEAVYDAAYNFLDRAYILFDGDPQKEIKVRLKGKEELNKSELELLAKEFFNELINSGLRRKISKKNKNIREYMVSAALIGASKDLQNKIHKESIDSEEDNNWEEDPLGIATTWEEQNKSNDDN
ncbi:MAG: His-Xaa-Ser system protein HxsD [Candidatus Woesearchaeota archaeon]